MNIKDKSYNVTIYGEEYRLVSDEQETHIVQAAAMVDEMMHRIAPDATPAQKQKVAVLAALQLASTMLHLKDQKEHRKKQEADLVALVDSELASL